ncbi:hypothetical protein Pcinc_017005 [Petrolisthes cinctipes]|uniref:Uncharacterized protein n=1 Tax=Petrolisthes cinctipes TaxID=88211 RepID=A0AAE1KLA1_PETCI|nr:hypothetical protein Pcinc_017005 [Petrolisthes cinctipes]
MKKLNCASLKTADGKTNLADAISHRMADAPALEEFGDYIEAGWTHFAKTVTDAAEEVLGFAERKNKDCTLGLVINTDKTEVMYQWSGVAPPVELVMSVAGAELQITPQFNYLGSVLSVDCSIDEEVNRRINKIPSGIGSEQGTEPPLV